VDVVANVLDDARDAVHDAVRIAAAAPAASAFHGAHPGGGAVAPLGAHLVGVLGGHQDDRHVPRIGLRLAAAAVPAASAAGIGGARDAALERLGVLDGDVLAELVLGGVDQLLVAHHRHGDVADEDEAAADGADDALDLEVLLGEELADGVGDGDLGVDLGDAEFGHFVLPGVHGELDGLDEL